MSLVCALTVIFRFVRFKHQTVVNFGGVEAQNTMVVSCQVTLGFRGYSQAFWVEIIMCMILHSFALWSLFVALHHLHRSSETDADSLT